MKRGLRTGLIAAAGLALAVLALPFVVPTSAWKDQIERRVSAATGRRFAIEGPVRVTLFPRLGLSAQKVSLANPAGAARPSMATADGIEVGVRLAPLLSGRIEIDEIVLDHPDIDLEVDVKGHANWTFARDRGARAAPGHGGSGGGMQTRFSGVRIAHGHLRYANARTGTERALDDLDAQVDVTELDRPMTIAGSFATAGRRVDFTAKASTPRTLIDDRPTAFDLGVKSELLQAAFQGTVSTDGAAQGRVRAEAPKMQELAHWLGARLPAGVEALSLASALKGDARQMELSDLELTLDGARIAGRISLDRRGRTPRVAGALAIDRLDLNRYIASPPRAAGPARPGPPKPDEWSRDPVSLAALRAFDARLALDVGRLTVKKLALGPTRLDIALADGHLRANLPRMTLYGGSGKAELEVDARASRFHDVAAFDGVALEPFLTDTIGVTQIAGTGTITLDVAAQGSSPDAIMHALDGKGAIRFRDGRIKGVDLGAVARSIALVLSGANRDAFTDYSSMDGSFTLSRGVLESKDFALAGPVAKTTGEGSVDIGGRSIDFKIVPKASAEIAKLKLSIGVPFRIKGPWRHVHYTPDLAGAVGSLLENFLHHDDRKAPDAQKPAKRHKTPEEALKNMLGIH